MIQASRALSEHKQRQRLNFLERVKQETYNDPIVIGSLPTAIKFDPASPMAKMSINCLSVLALPYKCPIHNEVMVPNTFLVGLLVCPADDCLMTFNAKSDRWFER